MNSQAPAALIVGFLVGIFLISIYNIAWTESTKPHDFHGASQSQEQTKSQAVKEDYFSQELIDAMQAERRYILKTACAKWNKAFVGFSDNPNSKALYTKKYKFAVCDILKCGFSSWLHAIFTFDGHYFKNNITRDNIMEIADEQARVGSNRNPTQSRLAWHNATLKIITVRNPFSRLVSAFNDKMIPTSPGFTYTYGPMSKKINREFKHLRSNPVDRNRTNDGGTATFEDFLNFVLASKKKDGHWEFFNTWCQPCLHHYDYIMKFETFNQEVGYLRSRLKLSEEDSRAFFPNNKFSSDKKKVEKQFDKISKSLSQRVYDHYKLDFELFGYEKPKWLAGP